MDLFWRKIRLSWNGFPISVASKHIKRFMCSGSEPRSSNTDTSKIIWLRLPYAGHIGESIVNRLVRKLKRFFRELLRLKILDQTKKLSSFCSNKDPTPMYLKSHVIYNPTCPACNAEYIGKTDRCHLEYHWTNTALTIILPCFNTCTAARHLSFCFL